VIAPLIDEHREYLILVTKENCATAAGRSHGVDLNFDNGSTHTASLDTRKVTGGLGAENHGRCLTLRASNTIHV
jgi:hypothetical protein